MHNSDNDSAKVVPIMNFIWIPRIFSDSVLARIAKGNYGEWLQVVYLGISENLPILVTLWIYLGIYFLFAICLVIAVSVGHLARDIGLMLWPRRTYCTYC